MLWVTLEWAIQVGIQDQGSRGRVTGTEVSGPGEAYTYVQPHLRHYLPSGNGRSHGPVQCVRTFQVQNSTQGPWGKGKR